MHWERICKLRLPFSFYILRMQGGMWKKKNVKPLIGWVNTARYLTDPTTTHLRFEVRQAFQLNFNYGSAFNRCAL